MQERTRGDHVIAGRETVAEGADLRVTILTLAAGQCIPWYYHTEITDSFFCMAGPLVVETRAPRATHVLQPGQTCTVAPMIAHYVHGQDGGPAKFMIVQGVGVYDFMPVGG